jgi:outer membrane receptor protein involved in Fe transport
MTARFILLFTLLAPLAGYPGEAAPESGQADIEEVVVEATRAHQTLNDIPVNASLLTQRDVQETAYKPADEILRQIPGFSLLRSADSIASAPTVSTVSLRGLGGNAASRTLVLLDGIPIHSPYSTEIFWARIPRHRISRVEVIRGGGANAWGNLSLGGVINIVTDDPDQDGATIDGVAGYPGTVDLAVSGSRVSERGNLQGDASWYTTDGYFNLPKNQRGPVDEKVSKDHGQVSGRGAWAFSESLRGQAGFSVFTEERHGGSALDVNETDIWTINAGLEKQTAGGSRWNARAFYEDSTLEDASVRILGDNEAEVLRGFEKRPATILGTGLTWNLPVRSGHALTAGIDYRWSDVRVDEWGGYTDGVPGERLTTRSRQDMGGLFVQDTWRASEYWQFSGSLRYDRVVNSGNSETTELDTGAEIHAARYPSNTESTVNGNLGFRWRRGQNWTLRGAAYRGFRAPTLRELYHAASTRGGVILVNNPDLEPERLVGLETGLDLDLGDHAILRLTLFRNTVEDLVQNITRGETGDLPGIVEPCGLMDPNETCRELDNVGEMQATGLEIEAGYQPGPDWEFQLSYLYNDTEITRAPDNPQLDGNRVRQAPEHALTARARHSGRWFDTSLLARYVGKRYEDDLNRLEVDGFLLFDLRFTRQLNDRTEAFLIMENLFDEDYEVKVENNGSVEIGRPRFVGLGLRFRR